MNYTDWCETVISVFGRLCREQPNIRERGLDETTLEKTVWGDSYAKIKLEIRELGFSDAVFNALFDLAKIGLVDDVNEVFVKLNRSGRAAASTSSTEPKV